MVRGRKAGTKFPNGYTKKDKIVTNCDPVEKVEEKPVEVPAVA